MRLIGPYKKCTYMYLRISLSWTLDCRPHCLELDYEIFVHVCVKHASLKCYAVSYKKETKNNHF